MENLTSLPETYRAFAFPSISSSEFNTPRSPKCKAEKAHLISLVDKNSPTVSLIFNENDRDLFFKYLSFCIKTIKSHNRTTFFPYINNPDFLLIFLNAFSFHVPASHINLRRFYCYANCFYNDLTDKDRALCLIDTASHISDYVITHSDNPYYNFLKEKVKVLDELDEYAFFFDVKNETAL
tara:strand:+ start:270 stop:812 length:543 start_codon:yes stop_codon:yes gene_type:complete